MRDDVLTRLKTALADRYTVERALGAGGMATVYLAHDRKLNWAVALKVLRPELAASLGTERFLREIEAAAKLSESKRACLGTTGRRKNAVSTTAHECASNTYRGLNRDDTRFSRNHGASRSSPLYPLG